MAGFCASQSHSYCRRQSAQLSLISKGATGSYHPLTLLSSTLVAWSVCPEPLLLRTECPQKTLKVGPHVHRVNLHDSNSGWFVQRLSVGVDFQWLPADFLYSMLDQCLMARNSKITRKCKCFDKGNRPNKSSSAIRRGSSLRIRRWDGLFARTSSCHGRLGLFTMLCRKTQNGKFLKNTGTQFGGYFYSQCQVCTVAHKEKKGEQHPR